MRRNTSKNSKKGLSNILLSTLAVKLGKEASLVKEKVINFIVC